MSHPDKKKSDLLKENDYCRANQKMLYSSFDAHQTQMASQHESLNGALSGSVHKLKMQVLYSREECGTVTMQASNR